MNNEEHERAASPRPWRRKPGTNPSDYSRTVDADGRFLFGDNAGPTVTDANLIVDAVNAYDRVIAKEKAVADEITHLRQTLKRLADMYMDHTVWRLSRDEQALVDEARAAIGEEAVNG